MGELSSNTSPFWIQIHGLPLVNMTIKNVVAIGKGLGSFLKVVDNVGGKKTFRSYLRILVEIKILEPLKPGFYLKRADEEPLWISFIYERLDFYCTKCGKIGHKQSTCRAPTNECHHELYSIPLTVNIFSNLPPLLSSSSAGGLETSISRPVHPHSGQTNSPSISLLTPTILKPLKDLSLLSNQTTVPLHNPHSPLTSLNVSQSLLHSPVIPVSAVTQDHTPIHHQTHLPNLTPWFHLD
jgi:hypothetical protein